MLDIDRVAVVLRVDVRLIDVVAESDADIEYECVIVCVSLLVATSVFVGVGTSERVVVRDSVADCESECVTLCVNVCDSEKVSVGVIVGLKRCGK